MSIYNAVYLSLLCFALIFAGKSFLSGVKSSLYILLVLCATFLDEIFSTFAISHHISFDWAYHLFNPIEYTLFFLYYLNRCGSRGIRTIIVWSIPLYIVFSLCISIFYYHFHSMPAININVEGFLLFLFYTHLLFRLDENLNMPFYQYTDFWISVGVLMFFGGAFIFLGLYPFLFNVNVKETLNLFGLITRPLNIVFYSCVIIGLLCSMRNKKYFIS